MTDIAVPFNRPHLTGKELGYIQEAIANNHLSTSGPFSKRCSAWLEQSLGTRKAILTNSCTDALEMAAILADIQPGDEVIMPSFTFVTTASAFVIRGAVPVFVDIRPDTLNLDETKIEAAITPKTKAIVPVHYAGVPCEMDAIMEIAARHKLLVIEDAAQGIFSTYRGKPLGSIGHLAALSFHETKNIISGEGGALLVNDPELIERAEYVSEKGTNRTNFSRGKVDKYTWVELGSSYMPSEMIAAFLLAQLENSREIIDRRVSLWKGYYDAFQSAEAREWVRRPVIPEDCVHNGHIFYLLLNSPEHRVKFLKQVRDRKFEATFHYVPLHSSPAGKKFGRAASDLEVTDFVSQTLVRLPLWYDLQDKLDYSIALVQQELEKALSPELPKIRGTFGQQMVPVDEQPSNDMQT